jgi:hypothetical protein
MLVPLFVELSTKSERTSGKKEWHCDCVKFWKTTSCAHAYLLKYGEVLPLNTTAAAVAAAKKKKVDEVRYSQEGQYKTSISGFEVARGEETTVVSQQSI